MVHAQFNLSVNGKCVFALSQQKARYPLTVLCDLPPASVTQKTKHGSYLFSLVASLFLFPATRFRAERKDICSIDRVHFT